MTREEATHVLKEISATLKSWSGFTEYPQAIDMAIEALQAEPVLHCKDCKYWHNGVNITYCYKLSLAMIKGNDYCSQGERRD